MPFRTPDEMLADEADLKKLVDAVLDVLNNPAASPRCEEARDALAEAVLPYTPQPVVGAEVKVPEIAPPPMAKFTFQFSREVTVYDGFTRVIEAYTPQQAQQIANEMAVDFDSDVPDDCVELEHMGSDFGQFDANLAPPVDQPKEG